MVLPEVPQARSDVGEHESKSPPVTDLTRWSLCFMHRLQDVSVAAERRQSGSCVEPKIDGEKLQLATLRKPRERMEGLIEQRVRVGVRRPRGGLHRRSSQIAHRLV